MTPRVLVLDDHPLVRKLVRATLESEGYEVQEAADGPAALALAAEACPDLAIIDLLLPGIDGVEVLGRLRELPGGEAVPAIAVSGYAPGLDAARAIPVGFSELLFKPVTPSRLLEVVRERLASADAPAPGYADRRVLVVDDDPIGRKLLALRLGGLGLQVETAPDGGAGLAAARARRPEVILSDVLMPKLDGFGLCRGVRAEPALADVPVILMSASYVEREDRELARLAGAGALVEKSPDHGDVLAALERALAGATRPAAPAAGPAIDKAHAERTIRQLERQAQASAALARQCAVQAAQLAVLAGVGETLAETQDAERLVGEVLARCAEATGLTYVAATVGGELLGRVGDATATTDCVRVPMRGGELIGAVDRGSVLEDQTTILRAVAAQLGQALALTDSMRRVTHAQEEVIRRLALAAEFRDDDTARHTERVGAYAALLGRLAGLGGDEAGLLGRAALMHDAGKLGIPDEILRKPGPLTPDERTVMERHAEHGHSILSGSGIELLDLAAEIALSHHERWDGGGYPNRLAGEAIPLAGRITAVADVFDALTSTRVYRAAMPVERAVEIMREDRGRHFDPRLLDLFLGSLDAFAAIRDSLADPLPLAV